jgi:nucleoside-diphosphate-sugar epimerase
MDKLLLIGCGDIGRRVAKLALAEKTKVFALARTSEQAAELAALGIKTVTGDLDEPGPIPDLPTAGAAVVYLAPPPGGGELDPRMRVFLGSIEPGEEPKKIVYISTSGVYGDCGGDVVTERTPTRPATARARRRLDAETILQQWGGCRRVPTVILRVTGIYGPGRLPIARLTEGHPVLREEEAPLTNRIHAEDLARICLAAAERGEAGEIYNVSDGHPTTMTAYFNAVADALGLPRPPQIPFAEAKQVMAPLMLSYLTESRRMDNRKLLERLGVTLAYPDLAAGLAAVGAERQRR